MTFIFFLQANIRGFWLEIYLKGFPIFQLLIHRNVTNIVSFNLQFNCCFYLYWFASYKEITKITFN